jgi:signal transduction histidine kinase
MLPAPIPADDCERVAVLDQHITAEDGPDDALQALAEAAARVFDVPIAVVSLVDERRQFFPGSVGVGVPGTPREHAFCGYTILQDDVFEVADAREDPRFHDNPLVTGSPGVVFYAAVPVVSACGHRLGAFCVIDRQPRRLSARERAILHDLGSSTGRVLRKMRTLKERNAALVRALARAEDAERAKSMFLASMTHELRTPLNAVIGFAQLIEQAWLGPHAAERYVDYAKAIRDSGEHLLSLINDILDVSRLEAGCRDLDPQPLALGAEVDWVCRLVEARARAAGCRLAPDLPEGGLGLVADRNVVRQVLLNLVTNAVKYGGSGGVVTIRARAAEGGAELCVADQGPGIAPEVQARLFQPFARGQAGVAGTSEGTGLGLYLVKGLAELAGGWLRLDSAPGQGTAITVYFPSAARSGAPPDRLCGTCD